MKKHINEIFAGCLNWLKNAKQRQKEHKLANKIIKEMQDAGLTHEQMLKVIKLAKQKFELLSNKN